MIPLPRARNPAASPPPRVEHWPPYFLHSPLSVLCNLTGPNSLLQLPLFTDTPMDSFLGPLQPGGGFLLIRPPFDVSTPILPFPPPINSRVFCLFFFPWKLFFHRSNLARLTRADRSDLTSHPFHFLFLNKPSDFCQIFEGDSFNFLPPYRSPVTLNKKIPNAS